MRNIINSQNNIASSNYKNFVPILGRVKAEKKFAGEGFYALVK